MKDIKLQSEIANKRQLVETSLVIKHSWQQAYQGILPSDQLDQLDEHIWQRTLRRPGRHNILALSDGHVQGVVSYGQARQDESAMENFGELMAIYVLPTERGKGVGTLLLRKAEMGLAELGFVHSILWVLSDNNPARQFYEDHGWHKSGQSQKRSILNKVVQLVQYVK